MKPVFLSLRNITNEGIKSIVSIIIVLFIGSAPNGFSQKHCYNPPAVRLSEFSDTTCYMVPVTINDNTFGGSATAVTITTDGHGSLSASSATSSPFSFTYTPRSNDAGRVVKITLTTNNPNGSPCKAAKADYLLTVTDAPPAPVIKNIIQTTCFSSTGSIELSGLPSYSDWIVMVSPYGMIIEGSDTSTVIVNLPSGIYTFTVSVSTGCISSPSAKAEIEMQSETPPSPLPGMITAPTCSETTGSVIMTGLPSAGTWTLTRYPGTIITNGTGTSTTVSELPSGLYNFTSTNEAGCVSRLSGDVMIPGQPPVPSAPVPGTIVQPTLVTTTGSVTLTDLPSTGTWTIIRSPGDISSSGSGIVCTITDLEAGTYTFRIINDFGCVSSESSAVYISTPDYPELVITNPLPVCFPSTVDITAPDIRVGSTDGLTYTYWQDIQATIPLLTPSIVSEGTYYIKGTSVSGYSEIKPVVVTVRQPPVSDAGPDQILGYQFNTIMEASLGEEDTGMWITDQENIIITDVTDPGSAISNLSSGDNFLSWIVTNGVCPTDTDKVKITVGEIVIPTLITPNGDSKNEYFVVKGIETLGRTELTVFDRRGIQIFRSNDYDNSWNGVDFNDNPLTNDTYFFVLTSVNGKSYSGYIVIRR